MNVAVVVSWVIASLVETELAEHFEKCRFCTNKKANWGCFPFINVLGLVGGMKQDFVAEQSSIPSLKHIWVCLEAV